MATPYGRYLLQQRLARGGMGEVFRAAAVGADGFEKPVVVKRVLPQFAGRDRAVEMFTAEAKLMTRLAHPNIVQVLDFGRGDGDEYFLVMELVDGVDLGRFAKWYREKSEPVPVPIAVFVTSQVLRGLGHAHSRSFADGRALVHRDVTPGNVLLSRVGEVKLADFGVALVTGPGSDDTTDAIRVGKPRYMSPEQYAAAPIDARADLFSVGVAAFQVFTGELPFEGAAIEDYRTAVAEGRVRRASALRPELPEAIDAFFERACAPRADDRFADAREMSLALAALRKEDFDPADADELALAVESVLAEAESDGVPVVRLSAEAAPAGDVAGELTRLRGAEDGRFTVRMTAATEMHETDHERQAEARPEGRLKWTLAAVAAITIGLAVFGMRSRATPAVVPTATRSASVAAAPDGAPEASVATAPSAAADGVPSAAPRRGSVTIDSSRPTAPAAPASALPAIPSNECRGGLHLFSRGSWSVTGGPSPVQAPGRYQWPCGTFALTAVSRIDAAERRSKAVRIREGQTAVFDLR